MSPLYASGAAIVLWGVSWMLAALWTRRTEARPPSRDQVVHLVPTVIGAILLSGAAQLRLAPRYAGAFILWRSPPALGWLLFAVSLVGLAFTWWARLALGDFWSGSVNRKAGHVVIQSGPYRLVRHPIYTGLILALASFAAQLASPGGFAGVALITFGFWLKARLEERFLSQQLGEGAYADYRRRTPMLIPFWPMGG